MKVLVLGLDGATWDVLGPLMSEGQMPNLLKLVAHSSYGGLESTIPPITAPAWFAMATGKSPGRTGIIDFFHRAGESPAFVPLGSNDFVDHGAIWDYLNECGLRTGVLNYPMLYPAYPINGFMVSGLGAPHDGDICYPGTLRGELDRLTGGYQIDLAHAHPKYENNVGRFLRDVDRLLDGRLAVLEHLIQNTDWDFLFGVISATDFLQHYMWKWWEPDRSEGDQDEARQHRQSFVRFWSKVDAAMGRILGSLPEDGCLILVSDHGFGPTRSTFYTNVWLEAEGFLVRQRSSFNRVNDTLRYLWKSPPVRRAGRCFPRLHTLVRNRVSEVLRIPGVASLDRDAFYQGDAQRRLLPGEIDWARTRAFALRHSSAFGHIYLNRCPDSPVPTCRDLDRTREAIVAGLRESLGRNIDDCAVEIYRREEIYEGEKLGLLPDVVFLIEGGFVSTAFEDRIYKSRPPVPNKTGAHRRTGVFVAHGPVFKEGVAIEGLRVLDVAPTVLHAFGLPIPLDMDGGAGLAAFADDFRQPMRLGESRPRGRGGSSGVARSDARLVEERLKDLGYID
jgi:predicted AlkP superfamily phosphohydrolase/phosphomutase